MTEFLALLSGMHCITVLHLEGVLPNARSFLLSGGLGNSPRIDLPHVTRLAITEPLSTVVAVLSCVDIPLKTPLSLVSQSERGSSVYHYNPILSFVAQRFSTSGEWSLSDPTFRSLIIDDSFPSKLTLSTSERDCKPRSPYPKLEN